MDPTPKYVDKIRAFNRSHKRMPSYAEVMAVVGFHSKGSTAKLVKRLVERHYLEKDAEGKLLPGRLFHGLRLLGTIEAGFPSPAEEELRDTMNLEEWLIGNRKGILKWLYSSGHTETRTLVPLERCVR
jgi:SOS-response transcriptional repressor LexA